MELEEMKIVWSEISDHLQKQKRLTTKMILMMTQEKYRSKWNRIRTPELAGTVICYVAALLIVFNFGKLGNWYNVISGLLCLGILVVMPIFSLRYIWKISSINFANTSCKDVLIEFTRRKKGFKNFQYVSYVLSFVLMFLIIPVMTRILKDKDLFTDINFTWKLSIPLVLATLFLVFLIRWVHRCTQKNIHDAETMIRDLESDI